MVWTFNVTFIFSTSPWKILPFHFEKITVTTLFCTLKTQKQTSINILIFNIQNLLNPYLEQMQIKFIFQCHAISLQRSYTYLDNFQTLHTFDTSKKLSTNWDPRHCSWLRNFATLATLPQDFATTLCAHTHFWRSGLLVLLYHYNETIKQVQCVLRSSWNISSLVKISKSRK